MATSANAIFTEVLEIQVDTASFQAGMDSLVQMYTQAIAQMNAVSGTSGLNPAMAQLAVQLQALGVQAQQSLGMVASASNVAAGQLLDVANAAMTATGALSAVSVASTTAGASASRAGYQAGLSWENFGRQIQRAMLRLPAMLLVATALAAVFETIRAPIKALEEGFESLEKTSLGSGLRESVDKIEQLRIKFEEFLVLPVFKVVSEFLDKLAAWLSAHGGEIEYFLYQLGQALANLIRTITTSNLGDLLYESFKYATTAITIAAAAANQLVLAIRTIVEMAEHAKDSGALSSLGQALAGVATGNPGAVGAGLAGLTTDKPDSQGRTWGSIQTEYERDSSLNLIPVLQSFAGLNGLYPGGLPKIPNPSRDTLQEVKAEFAKDMADVREATADAIADIDGQVHRGLVSHQDAAGQIHGVLNTQAEAVKYLAEVYKKLGDAAIYAHVKIADQPAALQAFHAQIDKAGTTLGRSAIAQGRTADSGGASEAEAIDKALANSDLAVARELNKEYDATLKDRYANALLTVQEYYAQKREVDRKAYEEEMAALGAEMAKRPEDLALAAQLTAKMASLTVNYNAGANATDLAEADALKKATEQIHKANDQLELLKLSEESVSEKILIGNRHRQDALSLEQRILAAKVAQAQTDLRFVDQDTYGREPGTVGYATGQVQQQQSQNALLAAFMAQIQGARASASTGLFPTYSGNQAAYAMAQQINEHAQTAYGNALMQSVGNPGSVPAAELQSLKQAADVAAEALKRVADAADPVHSFMDALKDATSVLGEMKNAVDGYLAGSKKGGWVGGVAGAFGNGSSDGGPATALIQKGADALSGAGGILGAAGDALGNAMPVIGPAIGMMFSTITSLFSSGIQKMVDAINKQINDIKNSAAAGQIGLGQEITELQQARQTAIDELGGSKKKGAQQQLNTILQSLDAQIAQLQFQQEQIMQNFENMVKAGSLDTLSNTFTQWYQTWDAINQQVKQYVDAGGSIATANEYLNQQLQVQRQNLQDQLNQGDQTALNDAIQLNQLLTQRVQLMKTEAQTEFGIVNADSVERRASLAVQAGTQLQQQRYSFQQQLLQMNEQITLDQQRLAIEGKIFDVSGNLQQLWAKLNADNITALNEQLQKYKDMQAILAATNGMVFNGPISNLPTANLPIPGESTIAGPITVNVMVGGNGITPGNAATIGNEIARGIRSGRTALALST
jgi:hypothetical protein